MNRSWIPLTGIAFLVLAILGGIVGGEPPDVDSPVQEIVNHYNDNDDTIYVGASLVMIGVVLFLTFASYLRNLLGGPDREANLMSRVAFGGAVIMSVGAAIDMTILVTLAEAVDDIEPASVQALQALWDNDYVPFVLGASAFLLGNGIAIIRTGALPKWLGWAGVVIAIIAWIPHEVSFISFPGSGLWVIVTSIVATMRARSETPATGATPGPAV